jgi:hypothetical protein
MKEGQPMTRRRDGARSKAVRAGMDHRHAADQERVGDPAHGGPGNADEGQPDGHDSENVAVELGVTTTVEAPSFLVQFRVD